MNEVLTAGVVAGPGARRTACGACGAAALRDEVAYPPFTIAVCSACGFRCVVDPADDAQLAAYYRDIYGGVAAEHHHKLQADNARINARRILSLAAEAGRPIPAEAALLDVGAGFGDLVAAFAASGRSALGVEPSHGQSEYARARGRAVRTGFVQDLLSEPARFNLVTMCDVIEHIAEPAPLLDACRALLRPGGLLAIKTDNFRGRAARWMGLHFYRLTPMEHIALYDPKTLRATVERRGFSLVAAESWTPAAGIRWAVKHALRRRLAGGREPTLPDPLADHVLGPPPGLLGRLSAPVFAALRPWFDRGMDGAEMLLLFQPNQEPAAR